MEAIFQGVIDVFGVGYGVPVAAIVLLILFLLRQEWNLYSDLADDTLLDRAENLRKKGMGDAYRAQLKRLLSWLNPVFGPLPKAKQGSLSRRCIGYQPWTGKAFDRLLLWAMIYPLAFLFLGWVFGNKGAIGEMTALEGHGSAVGRFASMVLPILVLLSFFRANQFSPNGWRSWSGLLSVVLIIIAFSSSISGAFSTVFHADDSLTLGIILPVAITYAFVGSAIGASPFLSSFAGVLIALADFGQGVVITTVLALIVGNLKKVAARGHWLGWYWLGFWLFAIFYVFAATFFTILVGAHHVEKTPFLFLILFLALLPLFNSPLDWLSFGFTRGLLAAIANGRHGLTWSLSAALIDVVVAIALLICVAASTAAGLWLFNVTVESAGAEPIIDFESLWVQLRLGTWQENLWIWMLFGSTLIPTAVHFLVALFALALLFSRADALAAANVIKKKIEEFKRRDMAGSIQDPSLVTIPINIKYRAFLHLYLGPILIFGFWIWIVVWAGYMLFTHLPTLINSALDWIGPAFGLVEVIENSH
ncbi:MAG: hypothetical protein ACWA44_01315 [Thiotrichales bacterium]